MDATSSGCANSVPAMASGPDFLVPLAAVHDAHRAHLAGWSIRALARLHWREWGYASSTSAALGLAAAMRALDLPVRNSADASRLAHTIHGNLSRALIDPAHPDHRRYLAHRRWLRRDA
jgi:hypothetical protein